MYKFKYFRSINYELNLTLINYKNDREDRTLYDACFCGVKFM